MDDLHIEIFTPREKRAAAAFAMAVLLLAACAVWVVRSGGHPAVPGTQTTTSSRSLERYATFRFLSGTEAYALAGSSEKSAGSADTVVRVVAYRTQDGARSWERLSMPEAGRGLPLNLQPIGGRSLLLTLGDPIGSTPSSYWVSRDAGSTWRRFPTPAGAAAGYLEALDERTAYLVSHPFGRSGGSAMSIYWTADGGASWRQTLELDAVHLTAGDLAVGSPYTAPVFADQRNGWMMSGSFVPRPGVSRPVLLRTADGGASWREVPIPAPPDKSFTLDVPVFPDHGTHGYLALGGGAGMLIYETLDGGGTWASPYLARVPWFAAAPDRWVYSSGRALLTSRDWGRTWATTIARLPRPGLALGRVEPTESVLWSDPAGAGPALLRSSDGGASWDQMRWPGT